VVLVEVRHEVVGVGAVGKAPPHTMEMHLVAAGPEDLCLQIRHIRAVLVAEVVAMD
jgi:hypothetical protein